MDMNDKNTSAERTFIIVEPDPVVGLDLAGALSSAFPTNRTDLFTMAGEAKAQLAQASASACILLSSRLVSEDVMSALRACAVRGAQIVFVGAVDNVDFPANVVEMPFTTQMIMDVLA